MIVSSRRQPPSLLENSIRGHLAGGMELSEEVRRFVEATFGDDSATTIETLISDQSSADRDSLLDLLFFPDQALQMAIEPLLETLRLQDEDVIPLADRFRIEPVTTFLRMPEANARIPLSMPEFAIDPFLARLNLAWQPADRLLATLDRIDARPLSSVADNHEGRMWLRVQLRNAGIRQTPVQIRFLCDFLERIPPGNSGFVDKLAYILVFMKEQEDTDNLYRALMARKKFIFQNLLKARRSAAFASRNNMETLIMTGVRTAHFDIPTAERTLNVIDTIAMAVFGHTEQLDGAPRDIHLGESLDPEELIRRLS